MIDPIVAQELLLRVLVAIATGGLIGLERERQPERKYAGLRTLALLCGAGPIAVYVGVQEASALFVGIYLGLAAGFALFVAYIRVSLSEADVGLTTSVTVFFVALLGVLVGYGAFFASTSTAIVLVALLAEKDRLHRFVRGVTDEELRDSLTLGALVFILYPIAPTDPVDPFGVVVPREVLVFAIFVLSIEFASYLTMAHLGGSRGLAVTGLLAGGANSFATASVLAEFTARSREAVDAAAPALLLATTSMIVRNVAIAVVLASGLLAALWQPAAAMVGLALVAAAIQWRGAEIHDNFPIELESPLSTRAAVEFSLAYVGILVVSVVAQTVFDDLGLYAAAFAGGLVSSAAVSVTAATVFSNGTVGAEQAAAIVVVGIAASLTSKIAVVELFGERMRSKAAIPMALVGLVGLAVFAIT